MAYGLFLYKEFVSKSNKTIRLEIFQKDYAGISAEIESMGNNPLVLVSDNANSSVYLPIVKSYLDISIVDTNQVDYSVFFTPDATKFKVIVKVNGTPEWSGYLTPDSFEQDLRFRGDISLTARDNLGMLSEFDYDLTNSFYSITTLIDTALTKIGFQFTLEYRINKVDSLDETIRNGLTQSKFWIGKTWQEVLETILTGMGCQMRYVGDNKFAIYDIGYLSSLGTPHTPQTFSFIEQGGNQEIIPAWKVLTINQDYGLGDNIYDGFVEQSDYDFYAYRGGDIDNPYNFYLRPFYTIPLSSDWVSTIPMLSPYEYPNIDPNNLYITGKSPETTLFMSSKLIYGKYFEAVSDGKAIQFKFKANNYPHYITQRRSGEYMVGAMLRARYLYTMKVRCNLFAQTATEKYVLQGQRWIPWTISYDDALEFNLPQTKESSVYGKQGTELTSQMDSPQDQDITIEAYGLGESANVWIEFYPYTATYTEVDGLGAVDDYPAIVFDVHTMKLSGFELRIVENEIGGLESKVTINANHNINGAVDLSLGEVPSGLGGYHTYLAGIFKNSHPYYPPMTGFHFAGGTNYKLSELIGREVAHHYKTQKNKLSGTIINSTNFAAMPSFGKTFTDGVKNYALNYGALDFRNETMQVELIEVEDYVTEDYTFVEAEVESGSGSMGSGEREYIQWSAAGNAKRIYELDTASEADQAGAFVFIDKSGLSAAKKVPISSLLVDAYTKTESDSRFASIDGDLTQDFSAKKLTTATLLLPQTAPILASGEAAIYSLDSGFSGELPSGAGSVTSIALTMPTGFSVSGSPITESGTFGVTFASGYFLPTTTQFATKADVSLIGAANGIAPLDSGGKVALQYLPSTLLKYMGVWDASTNTPTLLATDTNRKGQVWNVSVAGTQFGIAFKLGDWLIYNDSGVAEKSDNSDDVVSVNGYTGAVTLKTSDIVEQTNLYYTDARVKAYADTLYTPLAHASATNNPHSVTAAQVGLGNVLNVASYSTTESDAKYFRPLTTILEGDLNSVVVKQNGTNVVVYTGYSRRLVSFSGGGASASSVEMLFHYDTSASDFIKVRTSVDSTSFRDWAILWSDKNSGTTSFNWSAAKLTSTTLLLPQSAPTLASGEMAIYGLESGFSGELPSGAGSVTSISMVVPTGLSVTPTTITESGTFTISYASGYSIPTNTKQSEWDNAYTLRHNAVTLGTANGLSLSTQELSLGLASTTTNGALSSTDWNTFNGKQAKLIGTGASSLVRVNASGVVTYDDSTYLTGNQTITLSGIITGSGTTAITTSIADNALSIAKTNGLQSALDGKLSTTGKAADSDKLDGNDSTYFATASQLNATNLSSGYLPYWNGSSLANSGVYQDASGVGIGVTTSLYLSLNVQKGTDNSFSGTGYRVAQFSSTVGVNADMPGLQFGYDTTGGGIIAPATQSGVTNFLSFWTYNGGWAERMRLMKNGNIGIGYTTDQGYKLAVNGSGYFAGYFKTELTTTNNTAVAQFINNVTGSFVRGIATYAPNLGANTNVINLIGVGSSPRNSAYMGFTYVGAGSYSNKMTFGFDSNDHLLTMTPYGEMILSGTTASFKANSIKIGSSWEAIPNGTTGSLEFNNSGTKASLSTAGVLTISENINTNLRIPKVAPTSPTSGEYYFYIVE